MPLMLSLPVIEVRQYTTEAGKNPFGKWFAGLNSVATAKVTIALERLARGNLSNVKAVGSGVSECRLDFGPGYRIYLGRDGQAIVILLCGGEKKGQQDDIKAAKKFWADYKKRKKAEQEEKK